MFLLMWVAILVRYFSTNPIIFQYKFYIYADKAESGQVHMYWSVWWSGHFDLVSKYNVGLKTFLLHGLSEPEFYGDLGLWEPEFYGDLVYNLRKNVSRADFSNHFRKVTYWI